MYRAIETALTPHQRRVVIGVYFERKTQTQIARELGVCPSTVHRTLRRGERRLRSVLQFS